MLTVNNNSTDQTAQMHKLCVFVVRIWHKAGPSCSKLTTWLVNDLLKFTC